MKRRTVGATKEVEVPAVEREYDANPFSYCEVHESRVGQIDLLVAVLAEDVLIRWDIRFIKPE